MAGETLAMAVPGDSTTTSQTPRCKRSNIRSLQISRFSVDGLSGSTDQSRKIEVTTLCAGDVGWDILRYFCSVLRGPGRDIESRAIGKRAHMIIAGAKVATIVLTRSDG